MGDADGEGPSCPVRVVFVDDDTVIRLGTPILLRDVIPSGSFAEVEAFLAERPEADVVVLDLSLAGTGAVGATQGAAATRAVANAGYRVLIYTNERRRIVLAGCLAAGAQGVVHKAEPVEHLKEAIEAVSRGEVVITTALAGLAEIIERYGELPTLTPRQRQVLSRRARGEPFQRIASRMGISRKTAEEYMAEVSRRFAEYLQDHSTADLERHLGLGDDDLLA